MTTDKHHDRAANPRSGDPPNWHHETVHVNDVALHYVTLPPARDAVDHPTGAAPLVVLLHGFPECWYTWHRQLDALAAAGYRVVAPDLRGYNHSSTPPGLDSYRMEELVADVRGLVESRGATQAAVVGHDWGGLVAWECAVREPELVSQLAVLNAPHPDVYRRSLLRSPGQLVRSSYVGFFQLPWLPEQLLEADDYRLVERALEQLSAAGSLSESDRERFRKAMERTDSSGPLNHYRAIGRDTVVDGITSMLRGGLPPQRRVDLPTLLVWGERDPVLDSGLVDRHHAVVEPLSVRRFAESGHWPHAAQPGRTTDELLAFLDPSSPA